MQRAYGVYFVGLGVGWGEGLSVVGSWLGVTVWYAVLAKHIVRVRCGVPIKGPKFT